MKKIALAIALALSVTVPAVAADKIKILSYNETESEGVYEVHVQYGRGFDWVIVRCDKKGIYNGNGKFLSAKSSEAAKVLVRKFC
jgi:hypothetical protein